MLKMTVKFTAADVAARAADAGVEVEDFDLRLHLDFYLGTLPGNVAIMPLEFGEYEVIIVTTAREMSEIVMRFADTEEIAEELLCTAITRV